MNTTPPDRSRRLSVAMHGLVAVAVLGLAACGPASPAAPTSPTAAAPAANAPTSAASNGPKGQLVIAQGVDADTLDPHATSSAATWSITLNIFDT